MHDTNNVHNTNNNTTICLIACNNMHGNNNMRGNNMHGTQCAAPRV